MRRVKKALSALVVPRYWPTLAHGVVPGIEHLPAFPRHHFATVLDVGANKGQFASFARQRWPRARLICFEPLPGPRRRLAAVLGTEIEVHAVALGNREGHSDMHLASREDSSSLLPLGDAQKRLFSMNERHTISVPVRRLDAMFKPDELARPTLLKIDVQGFEFEALQGAAGILPAVDAVYVECSFVELYDGQKLAADVAQLLEGYGLIETGSFNLFRLGEEDVQADVLFERASR